MQDDVSRTDSREYVSKIAIQSITYCFTVRDAWKKPNEAFNIECIKQSYMCVRNCISNDIDK